MCTTNRGFGKSSGEILKIGAYILLSCAFNTLEKQNDEFLYFPSPLTTSAKVQNLRNDVNAVSISNAVETLRMSAPPPTHRRRPSQPWRPPHPHPQQPPLLLPNPSYHLQARPLQTPTPALHPGGTVDGLQHLPLPEAKVDAQKLPKWPSPLLPGCKCPTPT
jgi:hypothetical protein